MSAGTTKCPTCRRPAVKDNNKFFPFCSERCHLVDLGRWLNEEYRVPAEPADEGAGAPALPGSSEDES